MKRSIFLSLLLALLYSCQSGHFDSYNMSWIGWTTLVVTGTILFILFVLKKGVVDETEDNLSAEAQMNSSAMFGSFGNYIGGHPAIQQPVPGILFRKNSNCCLFFYRNHDYNPPELKFKIKIRSFSNISVEDFSSFDKRRRNGGIKLTPEAEALLKKKKKDQTALVTIDWTDGESDHSTVFSFDGSDAVKKANTAKENLLQALKVSNQ